MNGTNFQLHYAPALPQFLTSLIGRKREIADLQQLLTTSRLVSLVGAGGCGKTRLAHAIAQRSETFFPDGVCWVELAQVNDPFFVPQTVANALMISEQASISFVDALCEKLATRRLLLVLDNCEHLLTACAELVEKLLHATTIQVLTTSREPLTVNGETLYPVPPLTPPAANESLAELAQCDAVQLFIARARSIRPSFALTAENAVAIAAICRQLEGLPLAIELASARVNVLSVEQIQQRVDHSLDLLVSGTRTAQRHRSLRAAIDWSYDLLTTDERLLLRRLSLFTASFALSTVEATCAWGELSRSQILNLLTSLVNKSLVVVETVQSREARYRMQQIIRQYAGERLAASGEWAASHDTYLESFLAIVEEIAPKLYEDEQQLWMRWLEEEHDNLRVALAWAVERGHIETGLRIVNAIFRFWEICGYVQEGLVWFERLFAQESEDVSLAVRVNAFTFAAFNASFLGNPTALVYGRKAVALAASGGDEDAQLLVMALSGLSSGYEAVGDYQAAFDVNEQSLQLMRPGLRRQSEEMPKSWWPDDALMLGMTVLVQGGTAIEIGDFASAQHYLDTGLTLARAANDPLRTAYSYYFLGNLAYCQQAYTEAQTHYEQAVRLLRQLNATRDLTGPLQNLGHACLHLGKSARAQLLFQESLTIHQAEQNRPGMVECLLGFAALAILQNSPAVGIRLLAAAESMGWRRAKSCWIVTHMIFDHYRALACHALPEAFVQAEQRIGKAFSLPEAIAYVNSLPFIINAAAAPNEKLDNLSEREREVVILISVGKSNSEIAEQLVISKRTVEKHIANIFAKLGFTQRSQIVRWAMEQGLTDNLGTAPKHT